MLKKAEMIGSCLWSDTLKLRQEEPTDSVWMTQDMTK